MKISKVCAMRHKIKAKIACNVTEAMEPTIYTKALRVCLGQITIDEAITQIKKRFNISDKAPKQRVWVNSNAAYYIGVNVASSASGTGLGGSWFTRQVIITGVDEYGTIKGLITINKKRVEVRHSRNNQWITEY